ncbi:hypothetical protein BDR22DRAFT_973337 [Usnea florida]
MDTFFHVEPNENTVILYPADMAHMCLSLQEMHFSQHIPCVSLSDIIEEMVIELVIRTTSSTLPNVDRFPQTQKPNEESTNYFTRALSYPKSTVKQCTAWNGEMILRQMLNQKGPNADYVCVNGVPRLRERDPGLTNSTGIKSPQSKGTVDLVADMMSKHEGVVKDMRN